MGKWVLCCAVALVGCSSSSGSSPAGASGASGGGSAGTSSLSGGAATGGSSGANGGSSAAGTTTGGSSNAGTATGGSAGASAGSSNGGASTTDFTSTLVSLPAIKSGTLTVEQFTESKTTFITNFYAEFSTDRGQWDGCTRNQLGSCWYYDCPAGSNGYGAVDNPVREDAGVVYATGSSGRVDLAEDSSTGKYSGSTMTEEWPLSGGSVSFSVAGNSSVPAFSMQIPTPSFVFLTSINGETLPTNVTRSAGAQLVWTSVGSGSIFFGFFKNNGQRPAAFCQFDAAANAGSMPAAVLEKLDPGSYNYEFHGDSRSQMTVSDWEIDSYAYSFGTTVTDDAPIITVF